jgi:DNA-binding NtrC family response regulator
VANIAEWYRAERRNLLSRLALVLDDSRGWRELFSDTLSDQGWTVHASQRSELAMHLVRVRQPDLVVLDVSLPEYASEAVAAGLHIHYGPLLPILATARARPPELLRRIGAYGFLQKPLDMNKLFSLMERGAALADRSARLRAHSTSALQRIHQLRLIRFPPPE